MLVIKLYPWHSRPSVLTHSLGITWLVASNANSQAPPQTYWINIYGLTKCSGDTNGHLSLLSSAVQMSPKWFLGQNIFSNKWLHYPTNQPVLSLGNPNISKFSPTGLRNNFLNIAFTVFGLTTCPHPPPCSLQNQVNASSWRLFKHENGRSCFFSRFKLLQVLTKSPSPQSFLVWYCLGFLYQVFRLDNFKWSPASKLWLLFYFSCPVLLGRRWQKPRNCTLFGFRENDSGAQMHSYP